MEVIVSQISPNERSKYSHRDSIKARCYSTSDAGSIIDKWFFDNAVFGLKFKSKTWSALKRKATSLDKEALSKHFNLDPKNIQYSVYCGCSCGCSKGYIFSNVPKELQNQNIWAEIKFTEEELAKLKQDIILSDIKLKIEKAEHGKSVDCSNVVG